MPQLKHSRIWLAIVMATLITGLLAQFAGAAFLKKVPIKLKQPNGTMISCFATGDEVFHYFHDASGNFITKDPKTGYYVYAMQSGQKIVPSTYKVGSVNPRLLLGLRGFKIPQQLINQQRKTALDLRKMIPGPVSKSQATSMGPNQSIVSSVTPQVGTLENLVTFIRFSDEGEFPDQLSLYDGFLNGPTNSLQSYYEHASYNQLHINSSFYPSSQGTTVVSYQDPIHPRAYYQIASATNPIGYTDPNVDGGVDETNREMTLLTNAISFIQNEIPANLVIDKDGDGYVDSISFIVSGGPDNWADLLWPHMWNLQQYATINGKIVGNYDFQLRDFLLTQLPSGNYLAQGVLSHEMFHVLGGPDLYQYYYQSINPVGPWDVMDSGSYDDPVCSMCAYQKFRYMGWIPNIQTITKPGTYTINPLDSPINNCLVLQSPNSYDQYFLVEYRDKQGGLDSGLPDSGLLVYRIDTLADGYGNVNFPYLPDEVFLFRPDLQFTGWYFDYGVPIWEWTDGSLDLAALSAAGAHDRIDDNWNPLLFLRDGAATGLSILNVSTPGSTISFDVKFGTSPVPTVTPQSGTYLEKVAVAMSKPTQYGVIRYRTDGSDPTMFDPIYTLPITIDKSCVVTAKTFISNQVSSDTVTNTYKIIGNVKPVTISPIGGIFTTPQKVTITCPTKYSTIHYTTNGAVPTLNDPTYSTPLTIGQTCTLKAKAFRSDWTSSDTASALFTMRAGNIYYVNAATTLIGGNGLSWPNAFSTVAQAASMAQTGDEIHVAGGTYLGCSITLRAGVGLYGGYIGKGASPDDRDITKNATILDGRSRGAVITVGQGADSRTVVDGFTIRNGSSLKGGGIVCYLNCSPVIRNNTFIGNISTSNGGAICCQAQSNPIIESNTFTANSATGKGGAIFADSSAPSIGAQNKPNIFNGNSAASGGGAIACMSSGNQSAPQATINFNSIVGNSAYQGGGIAVYTASPIISNNDVSQNKTDMSFGGGIYLNNSIGARITLNTITGNSANSAGGGIACDNSSGVITPTTPSAMYIGQNTITGNVANQEGGGICCRQSSSPVIASNVIAGNSAPAGGGVSCRWYSSASMINNTICDNTATYRGSAIYGTSYSVMTIANNILFGSGKTSAIFSDPIPHQSPVIGYNDVYGDSPALYSGVLKGSTDISVNPMFTDAANGDYTLLPGSPCIDAGGNSFIKKGWLDRAGLPRKSGTTVDMGAYEVQQSGGGGGGGNTSINRIMYGVGPAGSFGQGVAQTIWSMAPDATGKQLVASIPVDMLDFDLSKDGTQIVFESTGHGIFIADMSDPSQAVRLTPDGGDVSPRFSADAQLIVFARETSNGADVYTMGSDGSGLNRLTPGQSGIYSHMPSFSPDGTQIVYSVGDDHNEAIHVMSLSGANDQTITSGNAIEQGDFYPSFSPDGKTIAFTSTRWSNNFFHGFELATVDVTSHQITRLSNGNLGDLARYPTWSPDGSKILIDSNYQGIWGIFTVDATNYTLVNLVGMNGADSMRPIWLP